MCYIMTATGFTLLTSKEARQFYGLSKVNDSKEKKQYEVSQ